MFKEFNVKEIKARYPKFFKEVSPDLLAFIFSWKTAARINEICLRNKVDDKEKIEKISYRITLALLGKVPKENLAEILEKGAGLKQETARQISKEADELIFSQVHKYQSGKKPQSGSLAKPGSKSSSIKENIAKEEEKKEMSQPAPEPSPSPEPETSPPPKPDIYREPIE